MAVERLRELPPVQQVADALPAAIPWVYRVEAAQAAVQEARDAMRRGEDADAWLAAVTVRAGRRAEALARPHLTPVINATGVILHTNLGRAPLGPAVLAHIE